METNSRLIIRIGRSALSFSTIADGTTVVYEPYTMNSSISVAANMREALHAVELLQKQFHSTLVMIDAKTMVMPLDDFDEQQKDTIFRYTIISSKSDDIMHTVLPNLRSVALFAVNHDLRQVLVDNFPNMLLLPAVAPVWRHLHSRSFTGRHQKLYAYFHDRTMSVFSFQQNRFLFTNSFPVSTADNALYYLLSVWKQLNMDASADELHMVGQMPTDGDLRQMAEEFIKKVYVITPVGEFNRAPVTQIKGMPYDLMTLYVKGI